MSTLRTVLPLLAVLGIAVGTTPFPKVAVAEPVTATAATGAALEAGSTALFLEGIRKLVDESIDKATNSADYLLFKSATELKSVLDSWERANSNLLEKSFRELNNSQRVFFSNARSAAEKLSGTVEQQMQAAHAIALIANQSLQDVRIFDGRLGLFQYSPRIVTPGDRENLQFVARGVNFDRADPQLVLPDSSLARRISLTRNEAVFLVPGKHFQFEESKSSFVLLQLQYKQRRDVIFGWMREKEIKTSPISVLLPPLMIGRYTLEYNTNEIERETWRGEREFHYSNRGGSRTFNQPPHDNGWRFQMASVRQVREWGEAGRGCHLLNNSEHGFSIEVRVGTIRKLNNPNAPGYQHCVWEWIEFKESPVLKPQPPLSGSLDWRSDAEQVLPPNVANFTIRFVSWDGRTHIITGSDTESFFEVVETSSRIVIKPRVPTNLNDL